MPGSRALFQPHGRAVATVREFALDARAQVVDFFLVDEQSLLRVTRNG